MRIEINTDNLSRWDGVSLIALVMAAYPDIVDDIEKLANDRHVVNIVGPITVEGTASIPPAQAAPTPPTVPVAPPSSPPSSPAQAAPTPPAAPFSPPPTSPPSTPTSPVPATSLASSESSPTASTPPEAPVYDSAGVQWNADHHAGSKAVTTDGTWRARRGGPAENASPLVTDPTKATKAAAPAPPPVPPTPAPPAAEAPAAPAPPPVTPAPTPAPPAPAPEPVTPTPEPPAPPAPATDNALTPIALMQTINAAMTSGKLQQAQLDQTLQLHNMKTARELFAAENAAMLPSVKSNLDAYIAAAA